MRWFRRPQATPAGSGQSPPQRRSPSLGAVLDHLAAGAPNVVLDLGPAVGTNVERFTALGCRVRVLDLHHSFVTGAFEASLPHLAGESVGAVLAWDVLDYLGAPQIARLAEHLAPACGRHGLMLVHASSGPRMPCAPLRYRILDRRTVACEGPRTPERPSPHRTPAEIARLLPDFALESSYLLRDGTREYLLSGGARSRSTASGTTTESTGHA